MRAATTMIRERRRHPARWLRDILRADVMHGAISDGLLPSEADLMLMYAVPRAVVREALDLLRREGIIERVQGTGTMTVAQRYAYRLVEVHGVETLEPPHRGVTNSIVTRTPIRMPRAVARHLDEEPGTECLLYEYVGYLDGQPIGVYTNYVRYPEAESVSVARLDHHWYAMLDDAGVAVGETDLLIEVVAADDDLAALLEMSPGQPLLAMQQVIRDEGGRPYDFAILRHRGDRISLLSRATRSPRPDDSEGGR